VRTGFVIFNEKNTSTLTSLLRKSVSEFTDKSHNENNSTARLISKFCIIFFHKRVTAEFSEILGSFGTQ